MRDIVNALFVRDGRILLARRSPHRAAYAGLWSFPGGHVEQDETLIEALVREVREEVGITPTAFTFVGLIVDPNAPKNDPATYHLYIVPAWDGGEPALVGDEHSELQWCKYDAAYGLVDLALDEYRLIFRDIASVYDRSMTLVRDAKNEGIEKFVVGAVIVKRGRVLVLTRIAHDFMGGLVELPSGGIERGEDTITALFREVAEETGLTIHKISSYLGHFDYLSDSGRKTRQFNYQIIPEPGRVMIERNEHSSGMALIDDSSWLADMRVWLDESRC